MTKYLLCLLFLFSPFATAAAASTVTPDAVNRAGEQRMLAQRIAKSFIQIGLNVLPIAAKGELDAAVARFEDNLSALEPVAQTGDRRAALQALKATWTTLKRSTHGVPQRETARSVARQADETTAAAENMTRLLQDSVAGSVGRLVALSGRQRMLSQRLTKAYLLYSWGDMSPYVREELEASVNEFSGALVLLKANSGNSPQISQQLEEISLQWEWLQTAVTSEGAINYRLVVAEASESILAAADRLTRLYERLPVL